MLCFAFVDSSVSRITQSFRQILMNFFGAMECVTSNELLDFDGDPDYGADPGILK